MLPLPSSPIASSSSPAYDEQLGLTFSQDFTSMIYNVTAVQQQDVDSGHGPAYLLNGLTDKGYWYQVGLSWNWCGPASGACSGYTAGFNMVYEVWDSSGNTIFPPAGGGGLLSYSGLVHQGDIVQLALHFSGRNVSMYSYDVNTGATASASYNAINATRFIGLPTSSDSNGFFTGLMTEQYHANPYYGNEVEALYSNRTFAKSAATMWIAESNVDTSAVLFDNEISVSYLNPNQLQSYSLGGATEYSDAYEFITGSLSTTTLTIDYLVQGGGSGHSSPALTYFLDEVRRTATLSTSQVTFDVDSGSAWNVSGILGGSTPSERWQTHQATSGVVSSPRTATFVYYHQFLVSFSYSVVGGGTGYSATTVMYSQFGANANGGMGVGVWADAQSSYTFQAQLSGSSASERWSARVASGTVSAADQITVTYYHQYLLSVIGGGLRSQWFDSGVTGAYTTPEVFGRDNGTGSRITTYSLDGGPIIATTATAGNVTVAVLMKAPHSLSFISVAQYQLDLDSGALQALNATTPPTIPGDNYWYDSGSPVNLVLNGVWGRGTDTGYTLVSYSHNGAQTTVATKGTVQIFAISSLTSPESVAGVVTVQYLLSTPSESFVLVTSPPISGDAGWYDSGASVTITYNYVWNVVSNQSRSNAIGYAVDGNATTLARSGSGNFSVDVFMSAPHAVTVNSVMQYSLATSGGDEVRASLASPTGDSFYDIESAPTVSSAYTWGVTNGNTRQNLFSFTLDGATTNVTRAEAGSFTTPAIMFDRAHALAFNSITQYLVSFQFKDGTGADSITPTALQIEANPPTVIDVTQLKAWLDARTSFQIVSATLESENVRPAGDTVYAVGGPVEETILARVFNAKLVISDYLGIPISGARTTVTLANGTSVKSMTGSDGVVYLGLIPLGTFRAEISYLGTLTTVMGDASTTPVTTGKVFASYPTFTLIMILVVVAVGGFFLYRRGHHR